MIGIILNKEELLNKAATGEKFNDKLKEEFLQEWPLDRILTMSIDEYVIGKGQQNKSLCYALGRRENTKFISWNFWWLSFKIWYLLE